MQLAEEIIGLVEGTKSKIIHEGLPQDDPKRRKPDITRAKAAGVGAGRRSGRGAEARARVLPRGGLSEWAGVGNLFRPKSSDIAGRNVSRARLMFAIGAVPCFCARSWR